MSARIAGKIGRKAIVIIRFFCCEVSKYRKRIAEYVEFCSPFFLTGKKHLSETKCVQKNLNSLYLECVLSLFCKMKQIKE